MFYRTRSETVFRSHPDNEGVARAEFIETSKKSEQLGKLNYILRTELERNDLTLDWKRDDIKLDFLQEVFNRAPLFLNMFSLRGYNKILFVGFHNAAHKVWHHQTKSDRIIHNTPAERWYEERFIDMNVLVQFLPIIRMAYGYTNFNMHVVQPPERRHKHLMHSMYKRYGIDLLPINKQYKHGFKGIDITTIQDDSPYDAIVFAGIPKDKPETTFTTREIHEQFHPWMTENYDIIDLYYQNEDPRKFYYPKDRPELNTKVDVTKELVNVWSNRALWDNRFRDISPDSRVIEYRILELMMNIHHVQSTFFGT